MKLVGVRAVQRDLLDDGTVLLEYRLGETKSYLWAITSSSFSTFVLPPRDVIDPLVRDLRNSLIQSQQPAQRARVELIANRVSEILLRPAADQIAGKRSIALVLDGSLQGIPFAVLPAPDDMRSSLLMRYETVVLPSASILDALRRRQVSRAPPPKTLAILADPVFAATDPRLASSDDHSTLAPSREASRAAGGDPGKLARLLFSHREAEAIRALVPEDQSLVALGFEATRELAVSSQLGRYRLVHFATHAIQDGSDPGRSGIVLSQFDRTGRRQDGFLDARTIRSLDLPADLVVLSACQTALGWEPNSEGLANLSQSFLAAGANRVVASLWQVSDAATARLMSRFYRNLLQNKLTPAAALRQAQLEMSRDPRWSSPFYWAGFVLQGDWR